jgi:hypothetical protein
MNFPAIQLEMVANLPFSRRHAQGERGWDSIRCR